MDGQAYCEDPYVVQTWNSYIGSQWEEVQFSTPGFMIMDDNVYGDGLFTQHTTYGALHALWGHYQQDEAFVDCNAVYPYHVPSLKATSFHDVGDPLGWTVFANKYLNATAPNLISNFSPHGGGCPCFYETIGN